MQFAVQNIVNANVTQMNIAMVMSDCNDKNCINCIDNIEKCDERFPLPKEDVTRV